MTGRLLAVWILCGLTPGIPARAAAAEAVDFNRDVRPILSHNCLFCHGPDPTHREAGLRLDDAKSTLADRDGSRAVVPGNLAASALWQRITTQDDDERMPPAKTGKRLTAQEITVLRRWIEQGAPFAEHWSYVKPVRPTLPKVADAAWAKNPVDAFVRARLEQEQLSPAAPAERCRLIRRLTLDLTGLPPTPEEVDRFVADPRADAYERLVDELLARPAYGEHWAHLWLDLARYADSAGYVADRPREIWAFRDYVIRSLNANKPFDQFTVEQIAGDLLPNPSQEQLIATAFHRNTQTNDEGGTDDEEFRNVAVVDRVNTTLAVWMGTTMACAQCHNHKYDPITQQEYFQFFAILNNTADNDIPDERPTYAFYTEAQEQQRAAWQAEIDALEKSFAAPGPDIRGGQQAWEQQFPRVLLWHTLRPTAVQAAGGAKADIDDAGNVRVAAGADRDAYLVEVPVSGTVTGVRVEAFPDVDALPQPGAGKSVGPGHGPGGRFDVTHVRAAALAPAEGKAKPKEQSLQFAAALAGGDPEGAAHVLDEARRKGAKADGWSGAGGKSQDLSLILEKPWTAAPGSILKLTLQQQAKAAKQTLAAFRIQVTGDERAEAYLRTPPDILALLPIAPAARSAAQQARLADYYVRRVAPQLVGPRQRLAELQGLLAAMKPNSVPVMRELPEGSRRTTHIQYRGNYLAIGPEVQPGVPAAFPPLPKNTPPNRLTLAHWLVDRNNPLTPRVIANRYWEKIFGVGLVATSEDFGSQGERPSHPELLDWLAVELVESGWDLKHLVRLLVTSAAYRQSSRIPPALVARDPDNRLLARGPRFRLDAEVVRDQALAAAGLLCGKMYGPAVRPPQPSFGLSAAFGGGMDWQNSEGEDRYRRGVYTSWRRTNPYPSMATFDAPSREVCALRRPRTNTPLQALVTLNDPVYIEAAQGLARRMVREGGPTAADKARRGFRLCLGRPPQDVELNRLVALHAQAAAHFAAQADDARKLATIPLGPPPAGADLTDLAAWTAVANVLLNLDEMLMN